MSKAGMTKYLIPAVIMTGVIVTGTDWYLDIQWDLRIKDTLGKIKFCSAVVYYNMSL